MKLQIYCPTALEILTHSTFLAETHESIPRQWDRSWTVNLERIEKTKENINQSIHLDRWYFIKVDDKLAGFYWTCPDGDGFHGKSFWIDQAFRGKGLGKKLKWFAVHDLAEKGLPYLTGKVHSGNLAMQSLNQKCGFNLYDQVGEWLWFKTDFRDNSWFSKLISF